VFVIAPKLFSEEWCCCESAVHVSCDDATSSERSAPDMALPYGEIAVGQITGWRRSVPRGQRVLDGLSGKRAKGRVRLQSKVSNTVSVEISSANVALIP
jgi:hypothetical protein